MTYAERCGYCGVNVKAWTMIHRVLFHADGRYSHCFTSQKRSSIDG